MDHRIKSAAKIAAKSTLQIAIETLRIKILVGVWLFGIGVGIVIGAAGLWLLYR